MRLPAYVALLCVGLASGLALVTQADAQQGAPARPAPAAKQPSPNETYAAMTLAERTAIQSDLMWTGHYDGIVDGDFGNRSLSAVRAFQRASKRPETGVLNPRERGQLAAQAKARQEQVGWRKIDDSVTGISLGIPAKLVPQASRTKDGSRWTSASGDIAIETFRISGAAATLPAVAAQLKAVADRKVDYDIQRPGFFVLIGTQRAKKFYIRAHAQDREVRGVTILYDAARDDIMQPVTVAISNAFAPFSGKGSVQVGGPVPRPKVEYSTGIVVSATGHVLADRDATEGCRVIQSPQLGPVERIANDAASGLALLRVYGAASLHPASLAAAAATGSVTMVGIADPERQNGGGAITTSAAQLTGADATSQRALDPSPPRGFSGGAAVDQRGRFIGLVLQRPIDAGTAALVSADAVRTFLRGHGVTPESAPPADIKSAVVRVICVRP
jgi:peptidoglycan hydrolase-like protein with peptidoglycan-binding domain